ncbi:MAG: hypothetical protein LBD35_03050 [Prevotellaceae bacterium]|jgi:hypothetical protein|nr:hypothetical protein [Prevotellaceae bacterium]
MYNATSGKIAASLLILLISISAAFAQNSDRTKEFDEFRRRANREYSEFRRRANAEYADFMRRAWKEVQPEEGDPVPKSPDPVVLPTADPDRKPTVESLPFDGIVPALKPLPRPRAVEPLEPPAAPALAAQRTLPAIAPPEAGEGEGENDTPAEPTDSPLTLKIGRVAPRLAVQPVQLVQPDAAEKQQEQAQPVEPSPTATAPAPLPTPLPTPLPAIVPASVSDSRPSERKLVRPGTPGTPSFDFTFYNTACALNIDRSFIFALPDVREESVADAWEKLSNTEFAPMVNECLQLRDSLNLCDWGYLRLLKTITESLFGRECNEAVLLQMFILIQSGYKMRIGRSVGRLTLLVPSEEQIYRRRKLTLGGVKHYIYDPKLGKDAFHVFVREFPNERWFSTQVLQPALAVAPSAPRTFSSERYPDMRVTASVNKNLIDYFNDNILQVHWRSYVHSSMSSELKRELFPALRRIVGGKSETEAANMLLNFVQTVFEYRNDQEHFGYERSLFADETFFYPYSDCEDRAILFAVLVRELLKLEVVLLEYPEHLATAVLFSNSVDGDHLTFDNRKFTICDPTNVGADIGMAMDEYKQTNATVVLL